MGAKTVRIPTSLELDYSTGLNPVWSLDWDLQFDPGEYEVNIAVSQGQASLVLDSTVVTSLSLSQDGSTLTADQAVASVGLESGDPVAVRSVSEYILGGQTEKPLAPAQHNHAVSNITDFPTVSSTHEGKVLGISNGSLGWVTPAVQQELRYSIVTPTVTTSTKDSADDTISATLQDRAVNVVEAGSGVDYVNLTFPASEHGYARDFFVRLVLTGTDVPAVSFSETGGGDVDFDVDDDSWAEIDLGVNLLMFTETSQADPSNS